MTQVSVMALLGYVVELAYENKNDEVVTFTFPEQKSKRFHMLCNPSGTTLYLVKNNPGKISQSKVSSLSRQINGAAKMFQKWSDFEAAEAMPIKASSKTPKKDGAAIHIKYVSDKWDGKKNGWMHQFETCPSVWLNDADDPTFIKISGGKMKIRPEGIVK